MNLKLALLSVPMLLEYANAFSYLHSCTSSPNLNNGEFPTYKCGVKVGFKNYNSHQKWWESDVKYSKAMKDCCYNYKKAHKYYVANHM